MPSSEGRRNLKLLKEVQELCPARAESSEIGSSADTERQLLLSINSIDDILSSALS
jgi:hypothetical protein